MLIDVTLTAQEIINTSVYGKNVVVIDVLRATSTIITALINGCSQVIPVREIAEAKKHSEKEGCLLGGERNGLKIPGFDIGNSPLEYTRDIMDGKKLAFCTTNGTLAIANSEGARMLLIGALLNARAVANFLAKQNNDAILACAGTKGEFTLEDFLAAGLIVYELKKLTDNLLLADKAIAAEALYWRYQADICQAMLLGKHGKDLTSLGFSQDVEYCAGVNKFEILPCYRDGRIEPFTGHEN